MQIRELTDLNGADQAPIKSDASLPNPVVIDSDAGVVGSASETPIVEKQPEDDDIVMLSDDENGK